ncbi:MAG: hypothetical protein Q9162_006911 [Coniocarpon cinnabarinum]
MNDYSYSRSHSIPSPRGTRYTPSARRPGEAGPTSLTGNGRPVYTSEPRGALTPRPRSQWGDWIPHPHLSGNPHSSQTDPNGAHYFATDTHPDYTIPPNAHPDRQHAQPAHKHDHAAWTSHWRKTDEESYRRRREQDENFRGVFRNMDSWGPPQNYHAEPQIEEPESIITNRPSEPQRLLHSGGDHSSPQHSTEALSHDAESASNSGNSDSTVKPRPHQLHDLKEKLKPHLHEGSSSPRPSPQPASVESGSEAASRPTERKSKPKQALDVGSSRHSRRGSSSKQHSDLSSSKTTVHPSSPSKARTQKPPESAASSTTKKPQSNVTALFKGMTLQSKRRDPSPSGRPVSPVPSTIYPSQSASNVGSRDIESDTSKLREQAQAKRSHDEPAIPRTSKNLKRVCEGSKIIRDQLKRSSKYRRGEYDNRDFARLPYAKDPASALESAFKENGNKRIPKQMFKGVCKSNGIVWDADIDAALRVVSSKLVEDSNISAIQF